MSKLITDMLNNASFKALNVVEQNKLDMAKMVTNTFQTNQLCRVLVFSKTITHIECVQLAERVLEIQKENAKIIEEYEARNKT
jgi:hypothetical protein